MDNPAGSTCTFSGHLDKAEPGVLQSGLPQCPTTGSACDVLRIVLVGAAPSTTPAGQLRVAGQGPRAARKVRGESHGELRASRETVHQCERLAGEGRQVPTRETGPGSSGTCQPACAAGYEAPERTGTGGAGLGKAPSRSQTFPLPVLELFWRWHRCLLCSLPERGSLVAMATQHRECGKVRIPHSSRAG